MSTTTEQIWRHLAKASFAVVSHVTPDGEPRSSGVVYTVLDRRMFVVVAADSWKARHIATSGRVAVTVPVRRGGIMSLVFPIPPATISCHASAVVHAPDSPDGERVLAQLGRLLMRMRDPVLARGRVPVA